MNNDDVLKYEAYCYKVWTHVEDIVKNKKQNDEQYKAIIRWVSTYHYTWLRRNPAFFNAEEFWETVESIRTKPQMVFGYRRLPSKNENIDWDIVSEDYYNFILSPFAPEMVAVDSSQKCRNEILNYLCNIPASDLKDMEVLDFGCGPGNLIPHVGGKIKSLVCIDLSEASINIAKQKASGYPKLNFEAINEDILTYKSDKKFDIIISSNSVLPKTRQDVVQLFLTLRELLKRSGKLLAILPAFDTTIYLKGLWEDYYRGLNVGEEQVNRISRAFEETKLMNHTERSYADDGHNIQCYHTEETIPLEMTEGGLRIVGPPTKVYYPWELTRKFDYGYFPDAVEEIWDWFVVSERGELNTANKANAADAERRG